MKKLCIRQLMATSIILFSLAAIFMVSEADDVLAQQIDPLNEIAAGMDDQGISKAGTVSPVSSAANDLGLRIFSQCFKAQPLENVFISPYSIFSALVMLYNGASANTRAEFDRVMLSGGIEIVALNASCMELRKSLAAADPKVVFEAANSIWIKKTLKLKENFSKFNKYYHSSEVFPLETPEAIDDWVKKNTHDKISLLLPDETIKIMSMALINAIYFKGSWSKTFEAAKTKKADFKTADGKTVKCDMMETFDDFRYFESGGLQAVELPYGSKRFVMRIFLPAPEYSIKDLINSLAAGKFAEFSKKFHERKGIVKIPKFKASYENELSEVLKMLGISDAFSPQNADFGKMAELKPDSPKLFVNQVIHKTFVEVNEEGTEAAAVTAVMMKTMSAVSAIEPFKFTAERPFVFAIVDSVSETLIFTGVINDPVKAE